MNPLHRIEPQLLTLPQFYGSAGEPTLGALPSLGPQSRGMPMPQGGALAPMALMGLLGMYPQQANGPGILAPPPSPPMDKLNDEPLDIMPDSMKFGEAFGKARKMGLVQFTWRGKDYTTKLKE
jgi:hypothetical protein